MWKKRSGKDLMEIKPRGERTWEEDTGITKTAGKRPGGKKTDVKIPGGNALVTIFPY